MSQHRETQAQWAKQDCAVTPGSALPLGAHLVTQRHGYAHHGIYVGDGNVVHYAGFSSRLRRGPVEMIPLTGFASGSAVYVRCHHCPRYGGCEVARRAGSRLGECDYHLLTNNCEHFCCWCLFGECRSEQVDACRNHPLHALGILFRMATAALLHQSAPALARLAAA